MCGILTSRAQFIGYMDADLATPIETLDVVVPLLSEFPVVVGLRRARGAILVRRQPAHRIATSLIFRAVASMVVQGLADTQCGFKFFDGDVARAAARGLRIDGFAFDVELLRALSNMGLLLKEIPVTWDLQGRIDPAHHRRRARGHGCRPSGVPEYGLMSALGQLAGRRILFLNWRDLSNPAAGGARHTRSRSRAGFPAPATPITLFTAKYQSAPPYDWSNGYLVVREGGRFGVYRERHAT